MESASTTPGYARGEAAVARSPVTLDELELLKRTVSFGPDDERALRRAGEVLADQVEDVLDVWYGFVGSNPHLVRYFSDAEGKPIPEYLARVRGRFARWIRDLCERPYDQTWLDYQEEIALRHTAAKKNLTDGVVGAPAEVPLRYIVAFVHPVTATVREFLARRGDSPEEVEAMHQAWFKAVTISIALWTRPYAREGSW